MEDKETYFKVLLPLRITWMPWYKYGGDISTGDRVSVNFAGRNYIGVVIEISEHPDIELSKIKNIIRTEPEFPVITDEELQLWSFMSEYYLCTLGEVYTAAWPVLKIRSERIAASAAERARQSKEKIIFSISSRVSKLEERLKKKLAELENSKEGTKKREAIEKTIAKTETELTSARNALKNAKSSIDDTKQSSDIIQANNERKKFEKVEKPILINGRGRKDYYFSVISSEIENGRNTLVLVPETSFGDRLGKVLEQQFGDRIIKFNSKMTPLQRRLAADSVRDNNRAKVIIGTRISLFLPFNNLGAIIIDEEQDSSFKQTEPSPRYNARDCALMLGRIHNARVILGSACPSFESLNNCNEGKYTRLDLKEEKQSIEIIDISAERRKRGMDGLFSYKLIDEIKQYEGKVVIAIGWERADEVQTQAEALFPDKEFIIMNMISARREMPEGCLCAVLQADACFEKGNFRADEHCLQSLVQLGENCKSMIIQTAKGDHPVFKALVRDTKLAETSLLSERKAFGLPPFTRIIDINTKKPTDTDFILHRIGDGTNVIRTGNLSLRIIIERDNKSKSKKQELFVLAENAKAVIDVDPQ